MPRHPLRTLPIVSASHAEEVDWSVLALGLVLEFVTGIVPVALLTAVDPLPACQTPRACSSASGPWVQSEIALGLTTIGLIMAVAVIPVSLGVTLRHRAWIAACAAIAVPAVVTGSGLGIVGAKLLSPAVYGGIWPGGSLDVWLDHAQVAARYGLIGAVPLVSLFAFIGTEVVIQEGSRGEPPV